MDQDVTKKLKGLDGTAIAVGYDSCKGDAGQLVHEASKSLEQQVDGLTDRTDGNTKVDDHTLRNNRTQSMQSADNDVKVHTQVSPTTKREANENYTNVSGIAPPPGFVGVPLGSPYEKIGIGTTFYAPSAGAGLPFDAMVLDERQMKQEKRKQANRESARRSRLRKQAEYEELVRTCKSLDTEKMALKSELEELKGHSEKLSLENAALREKLKNAQVVPQGTLSWIVRRMKVLCLKPSSMLLLLDDREAGIISSRAFGLIFGLSQQTENLLNLTVGFQPAVADRKFLAEGTNIAVANLFFLLYSSLF